MTAVRETPVDPGRGVFSRPTTVVVPLRRFLEQLPPDAFGEALTVEVAEERVRMLTRVDLRRLAVNDDQEDGWTDERDH